MPDARVVGLWTDFQKAPGDSRELGDQEGVVAVHAVLLHTGNVLLWSSRYESQRLLYAGWTWNPKTGQGSPDLPFNGEDPTGPWSPGSGLDIFCAHHVALHDGRIMVLGGASGGLREGEAIGAKGVWIFDPTKGPDGTWEKLPADMSFGRWYPTPVLMQDGSVVVFSGRGDSQPFVPNHEQLPPPNYEPVPISGGDKPLFLFPGMHLTKGGRVFYIQTSWQYETGIHDLPPTSSFELTTSGEGKWTAYTDEHANPLFPDVRLREEGSSILLPPASDGRILVVGGGWYHGDQQATEAEPNSWEILETQGVSPKWAHKGTLRTARINVNTILLPDGKVFIFGGHDNYKGDHTTSGRALKAEIFDPTEAMKSPEFYQTLETEPMQRSRMYHSSGVLLPDGSVLVAGGLDITIVEDERQPAAQHNRNLEIYQPPYFFLGSRAVLKNVSPQVLGYGRQFSITFEPSDARIGSVVLLRPASMTHHTDSEQRLVSLDFNEGDSKIEVTMERDPTVAPPGYYMLFVVDVKGRPCAEAEFVRVG